MPAAFPSSLTLSQARRLVLRAQGIDRPPARAPRRGGVGRAAARLGVIQIDSVNVLTRAHYMPLYSRLGRYPREELDRLFSAPPRRLLEQWGHEACLVTPEVHRLLAPLRKGWVRRHLGSTEKKYPGVMDAVHRVIGEHGPATGREVQIHLAEEYPAPVRTGRGWWNWTAVKSAIELAFHGGSIASAGRTASFERRYDLVERLLPEEHLAEPPEEEAIAALTARSLVHLGLGTARSVADYYRLPVAPVAEALQELEEVGEVERVEVEGITAPVWKDPAAVVPRRATALTLLSPFDPLIFERRRTEQLFGMRYRIGIYTPGPKRTTGYYSLPLLMGENIVARFDLKADRKVGELLVNGAFLEKPFAARWPEEAEIAAAAAAELRRMADWLELGAVVVPEDAPGGGVTALRVAAHAVG
ncbi:MAG TPA: crosslink repair DNA glycosylase YcaQ family protein [Actinomycetaceae bacterium]|nr:crosslink repair DNA glycosylase YcaQ family protein [Actinomycetaceae bacterium]